MFTLTWVVDDTADPPLSAEHGFAMWVEGPGGQVLFDTGGSGEVLLHNLRALDLDPSGLDAVVLSHGHDDHTGGLRALLPSLTEGIPVYAHPTLFRDRFSAKSGELERRGPAIEQRELADIADLRLSEAPVEVVPGVWTTGEIADRSAPEGRSPHHFILQDGEAVPDPYTDDLSLVLSPGEGRGFVVCGCCHAGLLNTLRHVRARRWPTIVGIAGGIHLVNAEPETQTETLDALKALDSLADLWLGHCSGSAFIERVREAFDPSVLHRESAGHTITVE